MNSVKENIPRGWQKKQIKDLLDYERPDKYIVENNVYIEQGTPVLTANKSFVLGYTDEKDGIYQDVPVIIFDDFTTDSKFVDFPFKVKSSAIKILKEKTKDIDLRFVYEKMKSINFPWGNHKRYYISQYQNMEVIVPTIAEQKRIAEILGTVDEEIQKTDEIITATEKLKRGLMQQLFTHGIGHTKSKKTKTGEIPEDWDVKELKDLSTKIGDGLHGTPRYSDNSTFYFINGNNISERKINVYPETKTISAEEYQLHKKDLNDRSILLSINGTIGNVGFYNGEKVVLGKSVAYINCDKNIDKEFIAYQIETARVTNYFAKGLTGTTIKNLSLATIRQTPIFLPEIEEQKKISSILSSIDEKISVDQKLKAKLALLKKGLAQDLLTGNKRVKL